MPKKDLYRIVLVLSIMVTMFFFPNASKAFTNITTASAEVGDAAIDFTLNTTDGKEVSLEDFRGKVIVISFWDCYADVCFTSVKALDELILKYPPEKFAMLTICYVVPPALAADNYKNLLKSCGMGQVILIDNKKLVKSLYHVKVAPTTFVIDSNMVIRGKTVTVKEVRDSAFMELTDALVSAIP